MRCPNCNNGILTPTLAKALVFTYRGFTKELSTELFDECSYCIYVSTEPTDGALDMQEEMVAFKREVNMKLSIGEVL